MLHTSTAVGAYVARPKKGIQEWVGGIDISSLYPSLIRSMNMKLSQNLNDFGKKSLSTHVEC